MSTEEIKVTRSAAPKLLAAGMRALAAAALLLAGAGQAAAGSRRNVIIISLDLLTIDKLGAYGRSEGLTPSLDAFSSTSTVFLNARSPASWTLPAAVSVLTGLYPSRHKMRNAGSKAENWELSDARLDRNFRVLPEVFKKQGYETRAFVGGGAYCSFYGIGRGFDKYEESDTPGIRKLESSLDAARGWLESRRDSRPFFSLVQGFDLLMQFPLPGDGLAPGQDPFANPAAGNKARDRRLMSADRAFGKFLAFLEERGFLKNTVVAFISTHGECIGACATHGTDLTEKLIHIPLIVYSPGTGGSAAGTLASLLDVGPTLISAAGLRPDKAFSAQSEGRVLYPFGGAKDECRSVFSETDFLYRVQKRAVVSCSGWKLVYDAMTSERKLYDLTRDPEERRDLFGAEPEKAAQLEGELFDWMAR